MQFLHPIALIALALTTLTQATILLANTTACTTLSASCSVACGPDYKPCGPQNCYNPTLNETCCTENIICPCGYLCNTDTPGCLKPSTPPFSPFSGSNCNATATVSASGYGFYGTSSAITSLTSLTNGTASITSASVPSNLTLPATLTLTATTSYGSGNMTTVSTSIVSGISAGAPTSNFTYASTVPPSTSTDAAPTSTGGAGRMTARLGGVECLVVFVVFSVGVMMENLV